MGDEWMTGINPGYRTKFVQFDNCTIEINRPILDDDEREKREETVRRALRSLARNGGCVNE